MWCTIWLARTRVPASSSVGNGVQVPNLYAGLVKEYDLILSEDSIAQVDRQGFPHITKELDFLILIAGDYFTIASPFRNPDHYQAQGQ
ncbi:hypothetical protein IWQ60_010431 [Tieghemiomyces parasiticus]|uniref:Uncharacterized protein n=1 Tax=Tieghemiomyces parasiticus TaxID=78921 RepID=A0A9W8DMY9_9FUNG|nr:hypothetical protein IWQ60_010431 [Tieghemiomyces parasiticus]